MDGAITVPQRSEVGFRAGVGTCFGTFGELLQGALPGPEQDFLVTLPIARWTTAVLSLSPETDELLVRPAGKHKALRAARIALARYGVRPGGTLTLTSDLPEGKGMSSSSADLVATVRAVGAALGIAVTPAETEACLRQIEPTDGLMYHEMVAFYHRRVKLHRVLGPAPPMTIVGIDEGGQVDTVRFNAARPVITAAERREYRTLLDRLGTALAGGDLAGVGRICTRSAVLNQSRCHKRHLERAMEISRDVRALGVTVAHSGTIVGILISGDDPRHAGKIRDAVAACTELAGAASIDHTLEPAAARPAQRDDNREGVSCVD
ncbi:kinase [Amycolatopsis mediterranei]|uniref:GHMP family kinase ATP-binding protein n=1 Tax=Amycolatopsis mediterranei TaxID=33910 RepID=UPI0034178FBC